MKLRNHLDVRVANPLPCLERSHKSSPLISLLNSSMDKSALSLRMNDLEEIYYHNGFTIQ